MRARAEAAGVAITNALTELDPASTGRQMADSAANAASLAYDAYADRELRQRDRTLDGTNDADGAARPLQQKQGAAAATGGEQVAPTELIAASEHVPVSEAVLQQ
jgi:hypothetical protein